MPRAHRSGDPAASRKLARRKLARVQSIAPVAGSTRGFGTRPALADPLPSIAAFASTAAPVPGTLRSVPTMAPLTWFGVMPGFFSMTRAATPETTPLAIEVPLTRK